MQFVQDHLEEDPAQLLLRHKEISGLDIKAAARQIAMRQKARHKLPAWAAHPSLIFQQPFPWSSVPPRPPASIKAAWYREKPSPT